MSTKLPIRQSEPRTCGDDPAKLQGFEHIKGGSPACAGISLEANPKDEAILRKSSDGLKRPPSGGLFGIEIKNVNQESEVKWAFHLELVSKMECPRFHEKSENHSDAPGVL